MKATTVAVLLQAAMTLAAVISEGSGYEVRRAHELEKDVPIVDMEVMDDRFPGIIFKGTAESVYKQMVELKPELFADDTPIEEAVQKTVAEARAMEAFRAARTLDARSTFNCNWYPNLDDRVGAWWWCVEGYEYLRRLGTSQCGVGGKPAYARVSCSNKCGMYLYNKQPQPMWVHCGDISNDIWDIAEECIDVFGSISGARDFDTHFIGMMKASC